MTKNRDFGTLCFIRGMYDPANRHIYEYGHSDHCTYSWDHNDIHPPELRAIDLPEFAVVEGMPQNNGTMPDF